MADKPSVKLVGEDGNVFHLLGLCQRALRGVGQPDQAKELQERVFQCADYDAALRLMMEYCDVH